MTLSPPAAMDDASFAAAHQTHPGTAFARVLDQGFVELIELLGDDRRCVAAARVSLRREQLSLVEGLDPELHLRLGRALAPLRDEGVFLIGSGMTYHNLRGFSPRAAPIAEAFDAWLRETGAAEPAERDRRLAAWEQAPAARLAHPREEHLLPMMVVAGAAGADRGRVAWRGSLESLALSAYHFG